MRARGGTRTAFQPLKTLGSSGNIRNPGQSATGTAQSEGQGVHIVHTKFLTLLSSPVGAAFQCSADAGDAAPHCQPWVGDSCHQPSHADETIWPCGKSSAFLSLLDRMPSSPIVGGIGILLAGAVTMCSPSDASNCLRLTEVRFFCLVPLIECPLSPVARSLSRSQLSLGW
jgi:hypothetical protein